MQDLLLLVITYLELTTEHPEAPEGGPGTSGKAETTLSRDLLTGRARETPFFSFRALQPAAGLCRTRTAPKEKKSIRRVSKTLRKISEANVWLAMILFLFRMFQSLDFPPHSSMSVTVHHQSA